MQYSQDPRTRKITVSEFTDSASLGGFFKVKAKCHAIGVHCVVGSFMKFTCNSFLSYYGFLKLARLCTLRIFSHDDLLVSF